MQMDEKQRRARVLNLLAATRRSWFPDKQRAVRQLLYWQPAAREIRVMDEKCPACKRERVVSYRLPEDGMRGDREQCGFYCLRCRWGTGGTRERWVRKGGRG